jgi:CBS domain-containing protein
LLDEKENAMMIARDLMTARVISVNPDTTVSEIAKLLVEKRISAVPVVDEDRRVLGIVSEGDLMHRPESGTEKRRGSWWLALFAMSDELAVEYSKSHGVRASDVMTAPVVTIPDDMPVAEIARTLEENHIKRVPVVADGRLVGIVSRANLLHGLATRMAATPSPSAATDQAIREDIMHTLKDEQWATLSYANVTVEDGVAHLWGMAKSDAQIKALEIVAENTTGVTAVNNHMSRINPQMFYGE